MLFYCFFFIKFKNSILFNVENSDYIGLENVTLTYRYGDRNGAHRCIPVTIKEDIVVEYNETFNVVLSEASPRLRVNPARNLTEIIIVDDGDCKLIKHGVLGL